MASKKPEVPSDLIPEILSRLPAKSLIRFRSVSDTWRRTIENREFIKSYQNRSKPRIFVLGFDRCYFQLTVRCTKTFRVIATEHIYRLPREVSHIARVLGCVDGLFLLYSPSEHYPHLLLWNPSIKKFSILPPSPSGVLTWSIGIGFDLRSKDYKHIRIPVHYKHHHEIDQVLVYMMGTNSWRRIPFRTKGDKPWYFIVHIEPERVCFRGILYMVAWTIDPTGKKTKKNQLVSFDLSTEEFSYADMPIEDKIRMYRMWHLKCASDGSRLGLVAVTKCDGWIWWARGEGGDVTWSKHYTFHLTTPDDVQGSLPFVMNIELNKCSDDGRDEVVLLLSVGDCVTLYNVTQSKTDQTLLLKGMSPPYHHQDTFVASSYVESLAFLN